MRTARSRWLLGVVLLWAAASIGATHAPAIAIIIDDVGYDLSLGRQALNLPGAVTYAFLPGSPYATELAQATHFNGREAMVHMPMEALNGAALGPVGLTQSMTPDELRQGVLDGLREVPHAVGVNNHMGSLLTRHPEAMHHVMTTLREQGGYYFVDSRTNEHTVAQDMAEVHGLPSTRRDVFLDNVREEAYIIRQFRQLIELALARGSAIAIAHPHPETLSVLKRELPRLAQRGLGLLPVSRIIERQQRSPEWHVSSYPSQLAAKNSKQ